MLSIETSQFSEARGWRVRPGSDAVESPQLVLYFASRALLDTPHYVDLLADTYPGASLVGCSTAGEILGDGALDDTAVAAALHFETTRVRVARRDQRASVDSHDCGLALGAELGAPDLAALIVLADGITVNGTRLLAGLRRGIGRDLPVLGGLAGDGDDFRTTLVGCGGAARPGRIAVVGLYGDDLAVSSGCAAGAELFGPVRRITRARGNVLFEIDGRPALDLYLRYLGDEAANLPASAQFLPLCVRPPDGDGPGWIRTPVAVDNDAGSLIYAAEIPENHDARLARTSVESLLRGADDAATLAANGDGGRALSLLISCVGRKMVLGDRTRAEIAAVARRQADEVARVGFYSYGEIGPDRQSGEFRLHNQSLAVALIRER